MPGASIPARAALVPEEKAARAEAAPCLCCSRPSIAAAGAADTAPQLARHELAACRVPPSLLLTATSAASARAVSGEQ